MNKPRSPTQIALEDKKTGDNTIDRLITDYIQNVVSGWGGWKNLTAGEMAMLLSQKTCLQMAYRCQAEVDKLSSGPGVDLKQTKALISMMKSFMQEFRQGQVALGLSRPRLTTRRTQDLTGGVPGDSIASILEEYAGDKKAEKKPRVV